MLEIIYDVGIDIVLAIQSLGDWLVVPMESFTFLGSEEFYLLLMPAIYWSIDTALGMRVGLILLLSRSINILFKWAFHMPRPYWYSEPVDGMASELGFGAPSGHSQIPSSIFGRIAVAVRKRWATVLLLTLIFLIGFSRMFLGVHFPHDVLTGWLFGGLLVWAFVKYEEPVKAWFGKRRFGNQIAVIAVITLVILLIGVGTLYLLNDFTIPDDWITNAVDDQGEAPDPLEVTGLINSAAAFFGLGAGIILLEKAGKYDARGLLWKRIVRYLIGVIGVLAIWMGLDMVFPDTGDLLSYSLRFVRYGLVAFWISYLAPLLFVRIGIAEWKTE